MQVRNKVSPICDQPSMNGHTQSGIYDLAQTPSGEITRYLNKALKVLIADDIKGHFNWVSQIINLMKTYDFISADLSLNLVKNKIIENFNGTLLDRIKNCGLGKKLRTYNTFKHVIKFEPYLNFIENTSLRKIYSRFRLS